MPVFPSLRRRPIACLLALSVLNEGGCRTTPGAGQKGDAADSGAEPSSGFITGVEIEVNPLIPTVVTLRWESSEPGYGRVDYGLEDALDQTSPAPSEQRTQHEQVIFGLKAGREYSFQPMVVWTSGEETQGETQSLSLDPPPLGLTRFTVSEVDEEQMEPGGFILTSLMQIGDSWAVIIDRDGDYVWFWQADDGLMIPTAKFNPDNHSVLYSQNDQTQESDVGGIMRVALDGTEQVLTRTVMGHHDFVQLPSGDISWLSVEVATVDIEGTSYDIATDAILEIPEGATDADTPRRVFSFQEDYYPAWIVCSHFGGEVYNLPANDFTHANSLLYDSGRDEYQLMSKNLDALLWIDRGTGSVRQQAGGLYSDFSVDTQKNLWSHGHMSHIWDGGMMVFDNGYHKEPEHSRLTEYSFDEETGTIELVWSYDDPDGRFTPLLGDAQRLGDTVLGTWTEAGMLTEVSRAGEVVWKAETELGTGLGRSTWVPDLYTLSPRGSF